jgi:hypothetical protein
MASQLFEQFVDRREQLSMFPLQFSHSRPKCWATAHRLFQARPLFLLGNVLGNLAAKHSQQRSELADDRTAIGPK